LERDEGDGSGECEEVIWFAMDEFVMRVEMSFKSGGWIPRYVKYKNIELDLKLGRD
jgi:hypothetical protein